VARGLPFKPIAVLAEFVLRLGDVKEHDNEFVVGGRIEPSMEGHKHA
jgi:hypothetical protein